MFVTAFLLFLLSDYIVHLFDYIVNAFINVFDYFFTLNR
nr:MAG: hypothetical protein [Bacteriophage sp.]